MGIGLIATAAVAVAATVSVPAVQLATGSPTAASPPGARPIAAAPRTAPPAAPPTPAAARAARARRLQALAARRGFFRSSCAYSHTGNDDPILMPGMAGMAMQHDFFANTTTDASSTAQSLRAAGTTSCLSSEDTAAYWVPSLFQDGTVVTPTRVLAYYQVGPGETPASIQPMPFGLQMIAGNEKGTTPPPLQIVSWSCGVSRAGTPVVRPSDVPPPACPGGSTLHLAIHFPECWDGTHLAGASQTNVAYSVRAKGCPAGYPVQIPALTLHVAYPVSSGQGITLSSAPGVTASTDTAHADFINAWDEAFLTRMVDQCIHGSLRCGTIGRDNQPEFNVRPRGRLGPLGRLGRLGPAGRLAPLGGAGRARRGASPGANLSPGTNLGSTPPAA